MDNESQYIWNYKDKGCRSVGDTYFSSYGAISVLNHSACMDTDKDDKITLRAYLNKSALFEIVRKNGA
jgi:hypothetical protein